MLKKSKCKIANALMLAISVFVINANKIFAATTPSEEEVNDIASKGLKIFFGALGGFAVILGILEFYGAFMAYRENQEQGGFGGAQNKVQNKIFSGIMCLIAATIIYIGLRWTQSLFDLA